MFELSELEHDKSKKLSGVTSGFVATVKSGPHSGQYMLKPIPEFDEDDKLGNQGERGSALMEHAFGGVFKSALGEQAPVIDLAKSDGALHMTSKFLDGFSHVDQFLNEHTGDEFKVRGVEKVVVTSLLCGDFDLNIGNLGVTTKVLPDGTRQYSAAKIDHGSAGTLPKDEDFEKSIASHYGHRDYAKRLGLDLSKTRAASREILRDVDQSQLSSSIASLKANGVDTKIFDVVTYETRNLEDLPEYLEARIVKLREFEQKLALVESIEHPDPEWKKSGKWLEAVSDPIGYAKEHGYRITEMMHEAPTHETPRYMTHTESSHAKIREKFDPSAPKDLVRKIRDKHATPETEKRYMQHTASSAAKKKDAIQR